MASLPLSIDSIIKKYEQRQEKLTNTLALDQIDSIDTHRHRDLFQNASRSGVDTPEFSATTMRTEINAFVEKPASKATQITAQKTCKKKERQQLYSPDNDEDSSRYQNSFSIQERDKLLYRLDQAQERLARSQKNYAQIWRKYELLLKESKKSEKSIELQQKLRGKESTELSQRLSSIEQENNHLKDCIKAKEANLSALREKLKEKNERILQAEKLLEAAKLEMEMLRAKQQRFQLSEDSQRLEAEETILRFQAQIAKFQGLVEEKEKEKKQLLLEMEKGYLCHREELEVIRLSYGKVQEQYKQWIEDCKAEKLNLIKSYEEKLREASLAAAKQGSTSTDQLKRQLSSSKQTIEDLTSDNIRLVSELRTKKEELELTQRTRQELILKVSTLENSMLDKVDNTNAQEQAQRKLQRLLRQEEQKNRDINQKYSQLKIEFEQLKHKHASLLEEVDSRRGLEKLEAQEVIRLRKEIALCREQLQRGRNNELSLTSKLNETISVLKKKNSKAGEENQELMTELMAERLQSARLRQEVQDIRVSLKRQYELSLQNIQKQLEQQIKAASGVAALNPGCDVEKEELYLQMRELERRYELLASEVVGVDQLMGIVEKVQRRYVKKK